MPLQNREEAQRAKDDLNGIMLHDNDLRIGWGKAIPIPSAPMFVLNPAGGVAPARGAAIAPPGSIGGAGGQPGPYIAAQSGAHCIVSSLLHVVTSTLLAALCHSSFRHCPSLSHAYCKGQAAAVQGQLAWV